MNIPQAYIDLPKMAAKAGGPRQLLRKHELIGIAKGLAQGLSITGVVTGAAYMLGQAKGRSEVENTEQA